MKAIFTAWALFGFFLSGNAGWIRGYGGEELDIGNSVRQTYDGGYILTGINIEREDTVYYSYLYLIKTDMNGDTLWTRIYEAPGGGEGRCVQQTTDSGYVIMGFTNVTQFPWPKADIWLLKTDVQGDTLWTKLYVGGCCSWGGWVEQTSDGGYIITSNWNSESLLLLKTDKNGNTEWSKNYQWGEKWEIGYCVRETIDGGYIVATSYGLFKTDSQGDSLWLKTLFSECVEQTSDNGYILATGHNNDIWLIKTNFMGDTLWTKTYGGDSTDISCDVHQTENGGYIIIGASGSFGGIWLLKTDANGDTTWTRIFKVGGVSSGEQTSDGGYIITGETSIFGDFWGDVLLLKTDSLGYVGVSEPVTKPDQTAWLMVSPIGSTVTLRYANRPQGFHATIYDASGRKIDELHSSQAQGTIVWGGGRGCYGPGVYFVKEESGRSATQKIVLIR